MLHTVLVTFGNEEDTDILSRNINNSILFMRIIESDCGFTCGLILQTLALGGMERCLSPVSQPGLTGASALPASTLSVGAAATYVYRAGDFTRSCAACPFPPCRLQLMQPLVPPGMASTSRPTEQAAQWPPGFLQCKPGIRVTANTDLLSHLQQVDSHACPLGDYR